MNDKNDELLEFYQYYYKNIAASMLKLCEMYVKELEIINPDHKYGILNLERLSETENHLGFIYKIINILTENSFKPNIDEKDKVKDLSKLIAFIKEVTKIPENELSSERILKSTNLLK